MNSETENDDNVSESSPGKSERGESNLSVLGIKNRSETKLREARRIARASTLRIFLVCKPADKYCCNFHEFSYSSLSFRFVKLSQNNYTAKEKTDGKFNILHRYIRICTF